METDGSLQRSQEPTSGPYPELNDTSPQLPTSLTTILIISSYLRRSLPGGLFLSEFPTKILYAIIIFSMPVHAPPISSSLI